MTCKPSATRESEVGNRIRTIKILDYAILEENVQQAAGGLLSSCCGAGQTRRNGDHRQGPGENLHSKQQ